MIASPQKLQPQYAPAAKWLTRAFALDLRGLAFLRMGFAAILLWDLAVRATALDAHYTDSGVLPRAARMGLAWNYNEPWWMSLHMLSGSAWWQGTLFGLAAIAAGLLLVGYQTRRMAAASWLLLLSLHGRNPLLLQGGDVLLRCLLFWAMFVPLSACWSVDAWLAGRRGTPQRAFPTAPGTPRWAFPAEISSAGTAAIIVQLACMYLFTALLKTAPSWRGDFSAIYYALSVDHYTAPLGYELLRHPRVLAALTAASWLLEWCGPLLLFAPVGRNWLRTLVPLAMVGFHIGLALTMTLGTFPWVCIVAWIALLPPPVWDFVGTRLAPRDEGISRSEMPTILDARLSRLSSAVVLLLLAGAVLLNVKRLRDPAATIGPAHTVLKAAGLAQYWNMFAPGPYEYGGWLRIEGETAGGERVNLYEPEEALPEARPALVSAMYPTQHWRRCCVTLWEYPDPPYRQSVLRYFVSRWNATHLPQQQIASARLVQMIEPTMPPGSEEAAPPAERRVLAEWPE
jgi:hypothetical protein